MTTKSFTINKGVGRSIQFKGIRGQYIIWMAGGLVGVLILFVLLYLLGISAYLCIGIALGIGTALVTLVSRISHRFGEHGLMKKMAQRNVPQWLRSSSRRVFTGLKK